MSSNFNVLPRRERSSPRTPSNQLKSCLRKGRLSKSDAEPSVHSSLASTASRTTNTPLSSQLQCELADDASPIRTSADVMLAQSTPPRNPQRNQDDSERQFMRISRHLLTEYNKGRCNNPTDAKRLLHHYLPTYHERKEYNHSLSRNFSVLPMFPEPNEHISFSMTRCIYRVFGPILMSEMNGGVRDLPHPAALERSSQKVMYHPAAYTAATPCQSPPIGLGGEVMFPASKEDRATEYLTRQHEYNSYPTQQFFPASPVAQSSIHTPRSINGNEGPTDFTAHTTTQTDNSFTKAPLHALSPSSTPAPQSPPSLLAASRQGNFNVPTPLPISSSLQKNTSTHTGNSPPPQPLPFFNKSPTHSQGVELVLPSNDAVANSSNAVASTSHRLYIETDLHEESLIRNSTRTEVKETPKSSKFSQYQRLNSKEMLPPIIPREDILYYPMPAMPPSSPCCFSSTPTSNRRQRRPPSYLQIYVKCEWSEPFVQPDSSMDIITWYKNKDNHVTADRTLVVCGTTSLHELVRSILLSFGLLDSESGDGPGLGSGAVEDLSSSLGCYKEVCFLSDVKATMCPETSATKLTPLPIPGFYYKYVSRGLHGSSTVNDTECNGSTVLSTDPVGLQRTLTAQMLDTPLFSGSKQGKDKPTSQGRTRLALVYCTKKRQAYLSSRTQRAVLPETIYHFQIVMEGVVEEDDLPSSFQTQIPVRCVSGTGGVQGGNVIDSPHEVNDLNRRLWGNRDVIGLMSPSPDREKNREKIIDKLSTPLFDPVGNQSLKEGVVERCLYQISSGRLSMRIAERTHGTVEACNGTTDWLARQVDTITKSVSKQVNSCMDDDVLNEYDQKLEALVTKVML